jgi:hypothetical protein
MGLPQGSFLFPDLFNVYLEEALNSSTKLEEVIRRGYPQAFGDDMLLMSNNKHELEIIVDELAKTHLELEPAIMRKKKEV